MDAATITAIAAPTAGILGSLLRLWFKSTQSQRLERIEAQAKVALELTQRAERAELEVQQLTEELKAQLKSSYKLRREADWLIAKYEGKRAPSSSPPTS